MQTPKIISPGTRTEAGGDLARTINSGRDITASVRSVTQNPEQPGTFRVRLESGGRTLDIVTPQPLPQGSQVQIGRNDQGQIQLRILNSSGQAVSQTPVPTPEGSGKEATVQQARAAATGFLLRIGAESMAAASRLPVNQPLTGVILPPLPAPQAPQGGAINPLLQNAPAAATPASAGTGATQPGTPAVTAGGAQQASAAATGAPPAATAATATSATGNPSTTTAGTPSSAPSTAPASSTGTAAAAGSSTAIPTAQTPATAATSAPASASATVAAAAAPSANTPPSSAPAAAGVVSGTQTNTGSAAASPTPTAAPTQGSTPSPTAPSTANAPASSSPVNTGPSTGTGAATAATGPAPAATGTTANPSSTVTPQPAASNTDGRAQSAQTTPPVPTRPLPEALQTQPVMRPSGFPVRVSVDGMTLELLSARPLQPGQQVTVTRTESGLIQLNILTPPTPLAQQTAVQMAMQQALREVLPVQIPFADGLNQLMQLGQRPQVNQNSALNQMIDSMLRLFSIRPGSADASQAVQRNLQQGGLLSESRLAQAQGQGQMAPTQDLKQQLGRLNRLAEQLPPVAREQLQQLVTSMLARSTAQQISSLQRWRDLPDGGQERHFRLDLPIQHEGKLDNAELRITEHRRRDEMGEFVTVWSVNLHFQLGDAGSLDSEVSLQDKWQISARFWAEKPETVGMIRERLTDFEADLRGKGFQVEPIHVRLGKAHNPEVSPLQKRLVDLHT